MPHSTSEFARFAPLASVLWCVALLAGCAAEPAPRPAYVPPPQSLNKPLKPVDEARRDRIGDVGDESAEAAAGVRGLTFAQFQQCMEQKAAIKATHHHLGGVGSALDTQKKSIDEEDLALNKARTSINPADGHAIDAFNVRVRKQHELVRTLNKQVADYNAEVEKSRAAHGAFSLNCAKRPFRSSDIERLPTELQSVAREDIEDFDLPAFFTDDPAPRPAAKHSDLDLDY